MTSNGWKGEWIELFDDGCWDFHRCVRCGQSLTRPEHREVGLGPECSAIDHARADRLRENARAADRKRWYERYGERVKTEADQLIRSREAG